MTVQHALPVCPIYTTLLFDGHIFFCKTLFGPEEMTQCLRAFTALVEDLDLISSTC